MLALALSLAVVGCSSTTGPTATRPTVAPTSTSTSTPSVVSSSTLPATATTGRPTLSLPTVGVSKPCTGAAVRPYSHVVWILMENRASSQVEDSPSAPYLARLGGECGMGTKYSGISHPSLPNYIALTSGGTQGVSDDADPSTHPLQVPSIFSLLGSDWRALEEAMPSSCALTGGGEYAVRHNPPAYYTNIRGACAAQDVPLGPVPDLSARFTFITPNLCDDMHDCSTLTGDAWLEREMGQILSTAQYRSGSTAVFITFDENDAGGSLVPLYVVAPSVHPGTRSAAAFDHYSLLRTTEELLGLRPLLGRAASAASMAAAFNL